MEKFQLLVIKLEGDSEALASTARELCNMLANGRGNAEIISSLPAPTPKKRRPVRFAKYHCEPCNQDFPNRWKLGAHNRYEHDGKKKL